MTAKTSSCGPLIVQICSYPLGCFLEGQSDPCWQICNPLTLMTLKWHHMLSHMHDEVAVIIWAACPQLAWTTTLALFDTLGWSCWGIFGSPYNSTFRFFKAELCPWLTFSVFYIEIQKYMRTLSTITLWGSKRFTELHRLSWDSFVLC